MLFQRILFSETIIGCTLSIVEKNSNSDYILIQ